MFFWNKKNITKPHEKLNLISTDLTEKVIELYWKIIDLKVVNNSIEIQMIELYDLLNNMDLLIIEDKLRKRTSYEYYHDLTNNDPDKYLSKTTIDKFKIIFYGLSTFSPNGYFREKSIKALGKVNNGLELPFIILRLTDWVAPVFSTSEKLLMDRLKDNYSQHFLSNYDFLIKARNVKRNDSSNICNEIDKLLIENSNISFDSLSGLSITGKSKNYILKNIILKKNISYNQLINLYIINTQPFSKQIILNKILEYKQSGDIESLNQLLAIKSSVKCKLIILAKIAELDAELSRPFICKLLFNKYSTIRRTARQICIQYKIENFREIYLDGINNPETQFGSIAGLGEIGKSKDAISILPFTKVSELRIKVIALKAISKLNIEILQPQIIDLLTSNECLLSKFARKIIESHREFVNNDQIEQIMINSTAPCVKQNCAILLSTSMKWDSIFYIIKYLEIDDQQSDFFKKYLEIWNQEYNRSFITPNKSQIDRINSVLLKLKNQNLKWVSALKFTINNME